MARFTEHSGDPAWLKSQREAQQRPLQGAQQTHRQTRAMPYPTQTPQVTVVQGADRKEFNHAASMAGNVAFVLGFLGVRRALKRR